MGEGQKNFHKVFARASLGFALLSAAVILPVFSAETATIKRQAAQSQYARAEEQRAALNSKPSEKRTLADYKQVVSSYRRVTLITPRAPEVPDSLLAEAELYTEMGDRFGRSYYQSAVDSYQFLAREYPGSHYCQDALLRAARLQRDQLGDIALASKAYEDFLKRYPKSPRKREAQEALAELTLLQASDKPVAPEKNPEPEASVRTAENPKEKRESAREHESVRTATNLPRRTDAEGAPRLRRIRTALNGDTTRVIIDLEDSVQYTSARIANPDRIFFDLHAARLTPELARNNIHVEGDLLTAIRVAQNQSGVVRVVLDINGVKDYSASLTNNPPQLLIDLYGTGSTSRTAPLRTAKTRRDSPETSPEETTADAKTPAANRSSENDSVQPVVTKNASQRSPTPSVPTEVASNAADNSNSAINGSMSSARSASEPAATPAVARSAGAGANSKNSRSKTLKATNASAKPDLIRPVSAAPPTRDGQSTLTRTLGLKIGRIVIDAGHGGHDTGTIGPTGLMEKDLCLDIALRLGKIIQQKLPGADVVYTRSDDTFIPLEERTGIANQAKADLFISIHANSSPDHGARGIETYYLNLRGTPEAMEVAARENAVSQTGIHDLEDLVKKITRTEKIDESKEFAEDIQDSLAKHIQKTSKPVKNRGVRKAPFVVLIGADMPSVLTEISFLSNPSDEQLLKKPEYRQHVAEGLYQGMAAYLESLNSVTVNLPVRSPLPRPTSTAAVEDSRNQN